MINRQYIQDIIEKNKVTIYYRENIQSIISSVKFTIKKKYIKIPQIISIFQDIFWRRPHQLRLKPL